jgi:hypothetical protein
MGKECRGAAYVVRLSGATQSSTVKNLAKSASPAYVHRNKMLRRTKEFPNDRRDNPLP